MDINMVSDIVGSLYVAKRATLIIPKRPPNMKKGQIGVLIALHRIQNNEGKARVSDIVNALKARSPNVIKTINSCVDIGLLAKSHDENDLRVVYIAFTEEGRKFYEKNILYFHLKLKDYFEMIDDDKWRIMLEMIGKTYEMVEKVSDDMDHKLEW